MGKRKIGAGDTSATCSARAVGRVRGLGGYIVTKAIIVAIAFFLSFFASLGAFKYPEEILAGQNVHLEIFRLRRETRGPVNVLLVTNSLLAAILAALIF